MLSLWTEIKYDCAVSQLYFTDKCNFIFAEIKAFEIMTISVDVFVFFCFFSSGLSVRGFGEELVVLCK